MNQQKNRQVIWIEAEDAKVKKCYENRFRQLWQKCFGDPKPYEDFYFNTVYPVNSVCAIEEKGVLGMLHLNPYRCLVNNELQTLNYIVGVATDEAYRRQGIMRTLLCEAFCKMYEEGQPFTYLMPANEAYYSPFSFVKTQDYKKRELEENGIDHEKVRFVRYKEWLCTTQQHAKNVFFQSINDRLKEEHCVFPERNGDYFDLIYKEKQCQNGDLVFVYDECCDAYVGYFSYAIYNESINVEQIDVEEANQINILSYFKNYERIKVMDSFSYMIRIVNLKQCISLFSKQWMEMVEGYSYVSVRDSILKENQGIYQIIREKDQIITKKVDGMDCNLDLFPKRLEL